MGIWRFGESAFREKLNALNVSELRKEYTGIDNDWLLLHYKVSLGTVIFALLVELIMGVMLNRSDMITTSMRVYALKFIAAPSGANLLCILAETVVLRAKRLSPRQKVYSVSLIFSVVCFVLFTAHSTFVATYFIFAGAIMMTLFYASYRLTSVTAFACIVLFVSSELFIHWDADRVSIFDSTLWMGNFFVSLAVLLAFSLACMVSIHFERKKREEAVQLALEGYRLQQRIQVDEMTGIFNRKALHDALKDMEFGEPGRKSILAIVDIDHFKSINDRWGHLLGDSCLVEFARLLRENGGKATAFRYGGDEFCLLFSDADMSEALHTCGRVRERLGRLRFRERPELRLTASFGLAEYFFHMDAAQLFSDADSALYEAKKTRNAIRVFERELEQAD